MMNRRELLKSTAALTLGAALSTFPLKARPETRMSINILDSQENILCTVPQAEVAGYYFDGINLKDAQFQNMDLTGCSFQFCNLSSANLHGCDMTNGDLTGALCRDTNMVGVNLTNCYVGDTWFGANSTLHLTTHLDDANFGSPSHIDRDTLMMCLSGISNASMVAMGYTQAEVTALRAIWDV